MSQPDLTAALQSIAAAETYSLFVHPDRFEQARTAAEAHPEIHVFAVRRAVYLPVDRWFLAPRTFPAKLSDSDKPEENL